MLLKFYPFVLLSFCGLDGSSGATREEAVAAFDDLSASIAVLADDLDATINSNFERIYDQLEASQQELFAVILAKANETETRINLISEEALAAGVDPSRCVAGLVNNVEEFRSRLTDRVRTCTNLTGDILPSIMAETWWDASALEADIMMCHSMSLSQCYDYSFEDACYDFFIANIERAKQNMATNFELMAANFVNRVTGMRLPCRDIIDFELIHYPSFIVKAASSCLEVEIRNSIPITCNREIE